MKPLTHFTFRDSQAALGTHQLEHLTVVELKDFLHCQKAKINSTKPEKCTKLGILIK